jgi:Mg2+ and Co2+ transporter CorA
MSKKSRKHLDEKDKGAFFEPNVDPHREFREGVEAVLSNNFMIFLAVLVLPILLIPMIVDLDRLGMHNVYQFLDACDVIILVFFIIEYLSKLYLATNHLKHFLSGWHLLDLVIIILSLFGLAQILIYGVSLIGAPVVAVFVFRGSRVLRLFALGSKTIAGKLRSSAQGVEKKAEVKEVIIREVDADIGPAAIHEHVTWDQVKNYLADGKAEWLDICNVSEKDFEMLSEMFQIPVLHFQSKLMGEGFPRMDYIENASLLFLHSSKTRIPEKENKYITISRTGVLIICNNIKLITISVEKTDLFDSVLPLARKHMAGNPSLVLILHEILQNILAKQKAIVADLETVLIHMEDTTKARNPRDFLERAFYMKKEVTRAASNMLHLKEVFGHLTSKRFFLDGYNAQWKDLFDLLKDEASYLQESADNAEDNLLSIIDMHLNRNSYETNKVMRVLAVLTALAILPNIIGGLLGENLLNVPFPYELWQVVAVILIGMSLILYVFVKLGWLKN